MTETTHRRPGSAMGGTGETGHRLVERLTRRPIPVRLGSRSAGDVGEQSSDAGDIATGVRDRTDQPNSGSPR
jgi:uncharacterized protein YbjT (DUF2867 family)